MYNVTLYIYSYHKCDEFIQSFKEGKLQTQAGCSAEETLEVQELCTVLILLRIYCTVALLRPHFLQPTSREKGGSGVTARSVLLSRS